MKKIILFVLLAACVMFIVSCNMFNPSSIVEDEMDRLDQLGYSID